MAVPRQPTVGAADADVWLGPGVELLGPYMEAGFRRPQYLLRRPDGQVVLVSELLYLVANALRHHQNLGTVARVVSERAGRPVSAAEIEELISTARRPAGVLVRHGSRHVVLPRGAAQPGRGAPLATLPHALVRAATSALRPLCFLPVAANLLAVLVLVDLWIVSRSHVVGDALVRSASRPALVGAVVGLLVASLAFHELGHATACRSNGGRPGALRVGIGPSGLAFDADVSDAFRLDRTGLLRTYAAGVYFDAVFALVAAAGFAATSFEPLLVVGVLVQVHALYQLLPFGRLDGYYMLGALVGVPNLFAYVAAVPTTILGLGFRRRRQASDALGALTPPARSAVRAWCLLTVALQAVTVAVLAYAATRTVPALARSMGDVAGELAAEVDDGRWLAAVGRAGQLSLLALPVVGAVTALAGGLAGAVAARVRPTGWRPERPAVPPRLGLALVLLAAVLLSGAVGLTVGRLNTADPARASVPLAGATTAPTHEDDVPGSPSDLDTEAGTAPAAAGPPDGGRPGPAAPSPRSAASPTAPANTPAMAAATTTAPAAPNTPATTPTGTEATAPATTPATTPTGTEATAPATTPARATIPPAAGLTPEASESTSSPTAVPAPAPPAAPSAVLGGGASQDSAAPAAAARSAAPTWVVQPGQHFWAIAEAHQGLLLGRAPTDQETGRYWAALVAANRAQLADPADPDLIFSGQVLVLPPAQ